MKYIQKQTIQREMSLNKNSLSVIYLIYLNIFNKYIIKTALHKVQTTFSLQFLSSIQNFLPIHNAHSFVVKQRDFKQLREHAR